MDDDEVGGAPDAEVQQVGPDARLLLVLVVVLAAAVAWMFLGAGSERGERLTLGSVEDVAQRTAAGPLHLADLPHLVVMRTPTRDSPVYDATWGEATGSLLLSSTEQLVVLDTADPVDGAELVWCPSRGVFEHPRADRLYAPDGLLVAGDGRRGMDRRALGLTGPALVQVDDGRWVSGLPRRATDTSFEVRGESCID